MFLDVLVMTSFFWGDMVQSCAIWGWPGDLKRPVGAPKKSDGLQPHFHTHTESIWEWSISFFVFFWLGQLKVGSTLVLYGTLAIKWDILTSFKNIRKGRNKHENKNAEHLGWAMSIAVYTKPRFFFKTHPLVPLFFFFSPWALLRWSWLMEKVTWVSMYIFILYIYI